MAKKISALGTAQPLTGAERVPAVQNGQTVALTAEQIAAHAAPTALRALGQARLRRVDMVMIGDSNQLMNGYGFSGGLTKALAERFGIYATALYAAWSSYHNNQGNPVSFSQATLAPATNTGLTAGLEALALPPRDVNDRTYAYLASGTGGALGGVAVVNTIGTNVKARWRGHFAYATFASGSGSFVFAARNEGPPYQGYAARAAIATNTGSEGRATDYLDVPADAARTGSIGFKWAQPGGTAVTGPFAGFWTRAENLDADAGISIHTLYAAGGQSLYDMAAQLNAWPLAQLTSYCSEIRRLQAARGQKPIVVFYVNSGLNDRNETSSPSLGWRQSATPSSPAAYLDNLEAMVARIDAVWAASGWPLDELHWLVVPSHPVADPDDAALAAYRAVAKGWAERRQADMRLARVTMIDLRDIATATEMLANGWYLSGGNDRNHLTGAGYDAIAARLVARIA